MGAAGRRSHLVRNQLDVRLTMGALRVEQGRFVQKDIFSIGEAPTWDNQNSATKHGECNECNGI